MNELANRKVDKLRERNLFGKDVSWFRFCFYSTHVLPKVKVNQTHSNKGLIVFIPIIFIY